MEKIKNILMILLAGTMCLLCYATLMVSGGTELSNIFVQRSSKVTNNQSKTSYKILAVPYRISTVSEGNIHTQRGISKNMDIFKAVDRFLFEAIGSMQEVEDCASVDYTKKVGSDSLIVSFNGEIPLFLMKIWTDSQGDEKYKIKDLQFYSEVKGIKVYFTDENTGKKYKSTTSASKKMFEEILEYSQSPNGIFLEDAINIQGEKSGEILSKDLFLAKSYNISDTKYAFGAEQNEAVLNSFDINPYLAKDYTESSGTKVYVDGDNILRTDLLGRTTYISKQEGIALSKDEDLSYEKQCALAVNKLYDVSRELFPKDSPLHLDVYAIEQNQEQITVLCSVKINGIALRCELFGAGAIIENGSIKELWVDAPNITEAETLNVMSDVFAVNANGKEQRRYEIVYKQEGLKLIPSLSLIEEK